MINNDDNEVALLNNAMNETSKAERFARFLAMGGIGANGMSPEELAKRSAEFRGNIEIDFEEQTTSP
jgi:hypothetical protein